MIEFGVNYNYLGANNETVATICPEQITAVIKLPRTENQCVIETENRTYTVLESYDSVMEKIDGYFIDQVDWLLEAFEDFLVIHNL